ncbi:MAG TPA: nitrilase-related carbon-nitrogen hydrolase, partial [Polyangiales bacterium]|nr:nitrilase-related carbon-nitrogen hydrolase [Polyangiales bacterium]
RETTRLTVALGEYDTGWHDPKTSIAAASRLIKRVAEVGADVVVLPELATTGATTEGERAVSIDSADVNAIRAVAKAHQMWVIAGIALREARGGCAVNAAIAINPSGEITAIHRKRQLFTLGGEDREFTAGTESTVVDVNGVKLGLFICYELRFPELFRPIADEVEAMVVVANWPANRHEHWDALLRARAIENQCFMIGVNRTGFADGLSYLGGSTVFDPWGDRISPTPVHATRIATIDTERVRRLRESHPFLRDRH